MRRAYERYLIPLLRIKTVIYLDLVDLSHLIVQLETQSGLGANDRALSPAEYEVLLNKHNWKEQEMYIVEDPSLPPSDILLLPPLKSLYKVHKRNQELPQSGESRGYVTIATYLVQAEDEEYGILGGQL